MCFGFGHQSRRHPRRGQAVKCCAAPFGEQALVRRLQTRRASAPSGTSSSGRANPLRTSARGREQTKPREHMGGQTNKLSSVVRCPLLVSQMRSKDSIGGRNALPQRSSPARWRRDDLPHRPPEGRHCSNMWRRNGRHDGTASVTSPETPYIERAPKSAHIPSDGEHGQCQRQNT